jgi:enoyl-[acyl-carrier protein] reductase I
MGLLTGKTTLIFGVANDHSIAWGIAQALHREGARLGFSYAGEALLRRVKPLAESVGSTFVEPCDVTKDEDIIAVFEKAKATFGQIDILIHAVAFAGREELAGPYSFTALAHYTLPLMKPGGSMLTLTYYGAEKAVPNYNVMGVAKAALEASVRYLANDLGPQGIRVNAISAGPIRTLSAAGVTGFKMMHSEFKSIAPLRRHVTIEDVGNAAVYLCSDLAAGVTGEVHYVDAGFNVVGVTMPEKKEEG